MYHVKPTVVADEKSKGKGDKSAGKAAKAPKK